MKMNLWKDALLFLAKVSKLDINEEQRKENEFLNAEIDVYRKQLEQLGRRPKFRIMRNRRQRDYLAKDGDEKRKRAGQ